MSETKHTPMPWKLDHGFLSGPDGSILIYYTAADNGLHFTNPCDISLIEAAPELLAALEALIENDMIPKTSVNDGGACKYSSQVKVADQCRAAIAKARRK